MNLELKDKVAIVTGAGQGVGRRLATDLAAEGACVVVNDLFKERADSVVQEITEAGCSAMVGVADITDASQVEAMVTAVCTQWGTVDILVNNAGIAPERRAKGGMPPLFLQMSAA